MSLQKSVYLCTLLAILAGTREAHGQTKQTDNTLKLDDKSKRPKAKIADLAWLEGRWTGEALGGKTEEVWAPPLGDSMMGMFRVVKDGKVVFSELIFITEEEGSLVLKLKHFDGDFKGWEEKDVSQKFLLVKATASEVNFEGLTYRKRDDGSLQAFVATKTNKGETKELGFEFKAAMKK